MPPLNRAQGLRAVTAVVAVATAAMAGPMPTLPDSPDGARVDGEARGSSAEFTGKRGDVNGGRKGSESTRGGSRESERSTVSTPEETCSEVEWLDDRSFEYDSRRCGSSDFSDWVGFTVTLPPGGAAGPGVAPVVVTVEDVQHLIVAPGGLQVQPDREWVLVNMDTVVWTEAAEQVFGLTVLNTPVNVRMTPVDFTWDFGDGSAPVTGEDPGAPWPEHTIAHAYTGASEDARVTLTTRWSGVFEVAGSGVWQPVQGLATTVEVSEPFDVVAATPVLVAAR